MAEPLFSCIVDDDAYLWRVARYIERNPLKAGMTNRAENYRWSSAKAHIKGSDDDLLAEYCWLPLDDRARYAEFMLQEDDQADNMLRKATCTGRPYGSEAFISKMELRLNKTLKPQKPGRPRKKTGECP